MPFILNTMWSAKYSLISFFQGRRDFSIGVDPPCIWDSTSAHHTENSVQVNSSSPLVGMKSWTM